MNTREEILDLAEKLIRTVGYNAFSYKDISTPLNIKNAAIHYHFPSKKELGLAVIQRNIENFNAFKNIQDNLSDPKNAVEGFIQFYSSYRNANLICFVGALGPGLESLPVEMQLLLEKAASEIRAWLVKTLQSGLEQNIFSFPETAVEKADSIITSLLASLIVSKIFKEDVFTNVKNSILKTI